MISLPNWVQYARRPSLLITWLKEGTNTPESLVGATITALRAVEPLSNVAVPVTGTFEVTDGPGGVFRWDLGEEDVATAGTLQVQFTATYTTGPSPAKTFRVRWRIEGSL